LEGFNLNVVDYLLKPIEFNRFMKAVNKVGLAQKEALPVLQPEEENQPFCFFYTDKKKVRVNFNDIVFVESLKDYVRITTEEIKLITKLQISDLENLLAKAKFFRIHKSYLVNLKKVKSYTSSHVEVKGKSLPLGRVYKEGFLSEMTQHEARRNQLPRS
jgi:DNA-binding LytR/AlgR family response regulator